MRNLCSQKQPKTLTINRFRGKFTNQQVLIVTGMGQTLFRKKNISYIRKMGLG